MLILYSLFISAIYSLLFIEKLIRFVSITSTKKTNYRGVKTTSSAGIIFVLYILIMCLCYLLTDTYYNHNTKINILVILVAILSSSFSGYIDDNGNDCYKGILMHLKILLKGEITAGLMKALIAIIVSVTICLCNGYRGLNFILNLLIICLGQNFINLFDLKPGRAIKTYIFVFVICLPFLDNIIFVGINSGLILIFLFYLTYEFKEICIMGDTGSNVLGIMLGITIVSSNILLLKYLILIFFITTQIYAEKKSISTLIENNTILKFLDMLGCRKYEHD